MKLSKIGRISMALVASIALGLGMTGCTDETIGYMWVLGTQYNQIAGFKIDGLTGNLTTMAHSPYTSGGVDPVSIVVKPQGRYVYVINRATGTNGVISVFSVGGDGVLTFEENYTSQGNTPVWAAMDPTGNFLYVLDQVAPAADPGVGDITVFAIDGNTGRLTLVTNQQALVNGVQKTYFPVGPKPTMIKLSGGNCMFALDSGNQTIFPYATSSATGQLTLTTNSPIATGATNLTSINVNGANVYMTDAGTNQILPYTVGTSCALNTQNGGAVPNLQFTGNPVNTLVDSKGKYLYVINENSTNSQNPGSNISAFTIDPTTSKLQPLGDTANPYAVGSGPGCIVEDPSNQYIYTSNYDGTVTGKIINQNTGQLSDLQHGSSFNATGQNTCLAVSGNVSP